MKGFLYAVLLNCILVWQYTGINMNERNKGKRLAKYESTYIVFDLETTGINVNTDDIIEISAVKVEDKNIIETFSTLVNPGRSIPYQVSMINHITDNMVKDAPDIHQALDEFLEFIGDAVLVGHNIHSFDMNFIYDAVMKIYGREFQNDYIDTLTMSRRCLPQLESHKLVNIAHYFGFDTAGAHRALNDCIMNQKCYEEMGKLQESIVFILCPQCNGEMVRRKGKFGEFYGCNNFPKCRCTQKI